MSEERFDRIEERLGEVAADVAGLKTDVAGLQTAVAGNTGEIGGLKADVADLRRHMGVLHEDILDRFRTLGEDDSLRREMRAGFAELRQILKDHIVVGDAADRRFAATLMDHERRITNLEQQ